MTKSLTVADIEVRTWPERCDVMVIDINAAVLLAHYPLRPQVIPGTVHDWKASYEERMRDVIEALETDQEYLQMHFDSTDEIKLRPTSVVRERQDTLLGKYGLSLKAISFDNLSSAITKLEELDINDLFHLFCDWQDIVDRHYPAGSLLADKSSWVHRASPSNPSHWKFLVTGSTETDDENVEDDAYSLFVELVDVELESFSFTNVLRWVYFHRTEFPNRQMTPLKALASTPL